MVCDVSSCCLDYINISVLPAMCSIQSALLLTSEKYIPTMCALKAVVLHPMGVRISQVVLY